MTNKRINYKQKYGLTDLAGRRTTEALNINAVPAIPLQGANATRRCTTTPGHRWLGAAEAQPPFLYPRSRGATPTWL